MNSLHFTHLRLCDGRKDKDVMMGHLSIQLTHSGNHLNTGDIIQVNSFTPLTYTPSGQDKPYRSPAVVIENFSKVGYCAIPELLNIPRHCIDMKTTKELRNTV